MTTVEFFDDIPYELIQTELTLNGVDRFKAKYDTYGYRLHVEKTGPAGKELYLIYLESPLGYY